MANQSIYDWAKSPPKKSRGGSGSVFGRAIRSGLSQVPLVGETLDNGASAANKAADDYEGLANSQWDRSMEGLGKSQGAYDPYRNWLKGQDYKTGVGRAYDAYGGLQYQYGKPSHSENQYQFNRDQLSGPSRMSRFYDAHPMGPLNTTQVYGLSLSQLGNSGNTENIWSGVDSELSKPGVMEKFQGENANRFVNGTNTERLYRNNFGGFGEKGKTETISPMFASAASLYNRAATDRMTQKSRIDDAANEVGGIYRGANAMESYAGRQLPGVEQQGLHEQFAQSALNGNNPYLQSIEDEGMARINQEMARRGHFASGGAATALGKFGAQMGAEKFKYMGDLTRSADESGRARISLGQNLATGSDQGALARGTSLQGLAGARDQELRQREALMAQAAQMASQEELANSGLNLNYAQAADQTRLARLGGMANLAGAADSTGLDAYKVQSDNAWRSQQGQNARLGLRISGAKTADDARLERLKGLGDIAGSADHYGIQQFDTYGRAADAADRGELSRLELLGKSGESADRIQMDRGRDLYTMGLGLDNRDYGIERQQGEDLFGLGAVDSGLINQYYGMGMGYYGQAMGDSFNAAANAGALRAGGMRNIIDMGLGFARGQAGMPPTGGGGYGPSPYAGGGYGSPYAGGGGYYYPGGQPVRYGANGAPIVY